MKNRRFTLALLRREFKGAALMGCDMIGLVAFDLVLGIVFRRVMHITLVVKIFGVDGNDGPRHSTGLGIPAYMIANLEPLSHLMNSSFLAEALLSIQSHHCAIREGDGLRLSQSADAIQFLRVLRKLDPVAALKLGPAWGIVTEPLRQLGARGDLLYPVTEGGVRFAHSAGPKPITKDR
jgi:hypothetical protein